jgi:hypothetical protein
MNPPRKVVVGPHSYQIVVDRLAMDRVNSQAGETLDGQCDCRTLTITIEPNLAATQMADTVVHELLHACFSLVGAGESVSADVEERLVRALGPVLLDLLRRRENRGFVEWLLAV